VATPEQVDRAIKSGVGFRLAVLGLVEFIDLGGVDILYYANEYLSGKLGDRFENPETVTEKFNNNELGPDTGKGYYDYDDVDVEAMFNRKYAGFLELLKAIRESDNLGFDVL
jgi:3-hydroxybutyryl-CoA dehydrogenase